VTKRPHKATEREAQGHRLTRNLFNAATAAERRHLAMLREKVAREKLYGGPQVFGEFMTPEMERRVRDSIRIVNLAHSGAGRAKQTETVAMKVFDEVAMLHSRGVLTDEQMLAAEKLQRDFFAAGMTGIFAFDYAQTKIDEAVATMSHDADVVNRMDAIDRYIAAIRVVPISCWPVVRDVVIQEKRLDVIRVRGMSSKKLRRLKIITLLQVGLDELARYYHFDRKKHRKHVKMNGDARPKREDFGSTAEVENVSEGS
jgi:hypothetical protein